MSETAKCRERLKDYCSGFGLDLGFGGDKIVPWAIGVDLPNPYTRVGIDFQNFACDARDLSAFGDNAFDFVFSSHLLEDFENTEEVVREWGRVIKPGGNLVLYLPDEQLYRKHCRETGQTYNKHHKHENFSADYLREILSRIPCLHLVRVTDHVDDYSFEIVARKI